VILLAFAVLGHSPSAVRFGVLSGAVWAQFHVIFAGACVVAAQHAAPSCVVFALTKFNQINKLDFMLRCNIGFPGRMLVASRVSESPGLPSPMSYPL